jgi:sterol 3beta-glucosyltransferase
MAAVVHHGGAGTTHYGLRAGVPSIIVPFFADQPFWGYRVTKLGLGPAPIPRKKLTTKRLAKAILKAINDKEMRQRAAELGKELKEEKGVDNAVSIIQNNENKLVFLRKEQN